MAQLFEMINEVEIDNDDVDFNFEKKTLEDLPRRLDVFNEIESCVTNTFFTDIKRRFDYSINFMQFITMRSRKRRQADISEVTRKDRTKVLEVYDLYAIVKDATQPEEDRQQALDEIFTALSSNRVISKKESVVQFLKSVQIMNINPKSTRAGLVQLFVKSVRNKFNISPSQINNINLRPRTTEQPASTTDCLDIADGTKAIQTASDMGGAFYILKITVK